MMSANVIPIRPMSSEETATMPTARGVQDQDQGRGMNSGRCGGTCIAAHGFSATF
jgi:hypothetical protein